MNMAGSLKYVCCLIPVKNRQLSNLTAFLYLQAMFFWQDYPYLCSRQAVLFNFSRTFSVSRGLIAMSNEPDAIRAKGSTP